MTETDYQRVCRATERLLRPYCEELGERLEKDSRFAYAAEIWGLHEGRGLSWLATLYRHDTCGNFWDVVLTARFPAIPLILCDPSDLSARFIAQCEERWDEIEEGRRMSVEKESKRRIFKKS